MKTVALISGGKDSCYNMMQCISEGHEIVALANLRPKDKDELDSYMYQTVGHHAIDMYAEAIGLPLYRHTIQGSSTAIDKDYKPTPGDEVEDLYILLKKIKEELQIEAVSVGAILSDYQRVRVENVCQRLGITSLAYLWRRDQSELLKEMIDSELTAVIIKVASMGLKPKKHLQKTLKELYPQLLSMNTEFQLNVCGEGGEYETFTTDCPIFNKTIVLDNTEEVIHSDDAFAPVGYLNLKTSHVEDKHNVSTTFLERPLLNLYIGLIQDMNQCLSSRLSHLPMKRSKNIHHEIFTEEEITSLVYNVDGVDSSTCISSKCSECTQERIKYTEKEIWISGITAVIGLTIEDQTKQAMDKLKSCIKKAGDGWSLSNICIICLYVRDLKDFQAINSVYKTYFGLNPPARVCVQVPLPDNVSLQLDCYGNRCNDRYTMHVQSISHWAPANIGPYSQAVKINNIIYVAGQIAMVPSTLQIITGGVGAEARLSLRHVERILQAMPGNTCLQNISMAICYVTNIDVIPIVKDEWNHAIIKYEDDSLNHCNSCLLEFVVVPKLPRNASVEWQVYANVNIDDKKVHKVIRKYEQLETIGKYIADKSSLSYTVIVDCPSSQNTPPIEIAVQCFCQCYSEIAEKSGIEQSCLPSLKIFYPVLYCTYDTLYRELSSQLRPEVIFALVPVLHLSTSSAVLLGCH